MFIGLNMADGTRDPEATDVCSDLSCRPSQRNTCVIRSVQFLILELLSSYFSLDDKTFLLCVKMVTFGDYMAAESRLINGYN